MDYLTILVFFVMSAGLGYTILSLVKPIANDLERIIMTLGVGLCSIPILLVFLNLIRIPLDYRIILLLTLIYPVYHLFKHKPKFSLNLKLSKANIAIALVTVMVILSFFMYYKGANAYPYLENDDPWSHALSSTYVSIEKTLYDPPITKETGVDHFKYIDPYPPGYSGLMGVLKQTSSSINWTLKFFNAVIISLSIFFFYFFAKEFFGIEKALFAAAILTIVPSYMSHFIWAISLVIPTFFCAMYCAVKSKDEAKYWIPGAILVASYLVTQNSTSIKVSGMLFLYWAVKSLTEKKFDKPVLKIMAVGLLLSMLWWIPMFFIHGSPLENDWNGVVNRGQLDRVQEEGKLLAWKGTADRPYSFNDFYESKEFNMINNPVGLGEGITILLIIAIILLIITAAQQYKNKKYVPLVVLAWVAFTYFGVMGAHPSNPVQFFAFRFWMLVAISVSLALPYVTSPLNSIIPKNNRWMVYLILALLLFITIFPAKFNANTVVWPPGIGWTLENRALVDPLAYSQAMLALPPGTKVFTFSGKDDFIIGLDKFSCQWCEVQTKERWDLLTKNATDIHAWLKAQEYEYAVVDGMATKYIPRFTDPEVVNFIEPRLQEMVNSGLFTPVQQIPGAALLRIN